MADDPVITAENLTVKFGDFIAVNQVSLSIQRGELFGFLGPNGSGKTTLIKALLGLVPISSGKGTILGLDVQRHAREIKQHAGYMSQKFGLYEDLTVEENIRFYAGVYGLSGDVLRRRRDEVVDLTGLGPYLQRRAGLLSGGWKQRLALSCAIVHGPEVVFLDEPTAGIDPVARRALWDLLFRLSGEGVTFFVTTHYMDEAERCGRVGYIYLSKLIAIGTVAELQRLPDVNAPDAARIEISAPSAPVALAAARKLPYVREATVFGRSVHAVIDRAISGEKLAADLAALGVHGISTTPIEPSLEDVFVTLTYRTMQESGGPPR